MVSWETSRPLKPYKAKRVKGSRKQAGMKKARVRNVPCSECGSPLEQERVDMLRLVNKYKLDSEGSPVYPLEVIRVDRVGPSRCAKCAPEAAPAFSDSVTPPPVKVAKDWGFPVSSEKPYVVSLRGLVDKPERLPKVKPYKPIPGEAAPITSNLGFMRGRVTPPGEVRANPWDRKPRDAGRRDFEAPTESNAVRKASKVRKPKTDVANAQALGSI